MAVMAQFDFDSHEYYRVLLAAWRQDPNRWFVWAFGLGVPATIIWLNVGRHWDEVRPWEAFWSVLPWVLLGAFYLLLVPTVYRTAARKALANDPSLRGPQSRSVDENGLHVRGASFAQDFAWSDIVRVVETPDFFLFYYNRRAAHYVPKRVLDAAGIEQVRALVRSKLSHRATVLR
jgi:hypothetical protein